MRKLVAWLPAAALAGVIGLELANFLAPLPEPPPVPVAAGAPHVAVRRAALPAGWQVTLLARPLFSPGRRPPRVADGGARTPGLPRLTGVVVAPDGRRAIFAGGKVLAEGAMLGRYRIAAIEVGRVTLQGPEGPEVLRPAFAGGARTAPPARAATLAAARPAPEPEPPASPLRAPK